jgi:cellulose synthase/poly-beta-1,6-N-acetylglucosamine synthase-like glycosyltransferase
VTSTVPAPARAGAPSRVPRRSGLPPITAAADGAARVRVHPAQRGGRVLPVESWLGGLPGRPSAWTALLPSSMRPQVSMVAVDYAEREQVLAEHGPDAVREIATQLAAAVHAALPAPDAPVTTSEGQVLAPLGAVRTGVLERALQQMVDQLSAEGVRLGGRRMAITPAIGWSVAATLGPRAVPELVQQAQEAAYEARARLDAVPRRWSAPVQLRRPLLSHRTKRQVVVTSLVALLWPLAIVGLSLASGVEPADWIFRVVVAGLLLTSAMIWVESILALPAAAPPPLADSDRPLMTAVIAAHLPNEAATIVETLRAFLRVDYDRTEIVLAYNTPHPLPVEAELWALAAEHEQLTVVHVPFSNSKAQNVNAALHLATGDVIGVFDADHHPAPDSFSRAAAWLADGADVVQGRCIVRNGTESPVSGLIAREFDAIYGVSHLGRSRLHGFAIFGGSNGWFRAELLRRLRLRPDMLTEDIDISMRALLGGAHLVYDPDMISTELAPVTVASWWRQRARWAQGWYQVSLRRLGACLRSPQLTLRQRLGALVLLGWREVAPWLSLAVLPLLVWSTWFDGTPGVPLNVPALLLALAFTSLAGPFQTWVAYRTTPAPLRAPARRYAGYALMSLLWYAELKNVVARVAQLKETVGERRWVTTPRTAGTVVAAAPRTAEVAA